MGAAVAAPTFICFMRDRFVNEYRTFRLRAKTLPRAGDHQKITAPKNIGAANKLIYLIKALWKENLSGADSAASRKSAQAHPAPGSFLRP